MLRMGLQRVTPMLRHAHVYVLSGSVSFAKTFPVSRVSCSRQAGSLTAWSAVAIVPCRLLAPPQAGPRWH